MTKVKKSVERVGAVARKAASKKAATRGRPPAKVKAKSAVAKVKAPTAKAKSAAVKTVKQTRGAIDPGIAEAQFVIAHGKVVKDNLGWKKLPEVKALLAKLKGLKSAA